MNITIGDIINEILPFSNITAVSIRGDFPWLSATIVSRSSCAKLFLYVKQIADNTYSAAVTDDVFNGNRLVPTDSVATPFVKEKEYFGDTSKLSGRNNIVGAHHFKIWLFEILHEYGVILFDPASWYKKMMDLGFNSTRIKRHLDKTLHNMKIGRGYISDLIDQVNSGNSFSLIGLEDKEIRCIYAKLKSLGLESIISDRKIIKIEYERR